MNSQQLHQAIDQEDFSLIEKCIEQNVDLKNAKFKGKTPLNHAIERKHLEICQYLIQKQVDIEAMNDEADIDTHSTAHQRPLHLAVRMNFLEIVMALVKAGANKEPLDAKQYRPIDYAMKEGYLNIFAYLLDQQCDIVSARGEHATILHLSIHEFATVPGPMGFFMPQHQDVAQRKIMEWLIQKEPRLLKQNSADRSPFGQAMDIVLEKQKRGHYIAQLCDIGALLVYYQAKQSKIELLEIKNSKLLEESLSNILRSMNIIAASVPENVSVNLLEALKQCISYKRMTYFCREILEQEKNLKSEKAYIFELLMEILYSFKIDARFSLEVLSLSHSLYMGHKTGSPIHNIPNELMDKILFYAIEVFREDETTYHIKGFECLSHAYATASDIVGDKYQSAINLWRQQLPKIRSKSFETLRTTLRQ